MPYTTQEQATLDAVAMAKNSEFKATALKLELEAQLDRNSQDSESCDECHGGWVTCDECDGDFRPECDVDECEDDDCEQRHDYCNYCNDGDIRCEACDGEGSVGGSWSDEDYCHQWFLERFREEGLTVGAAISHAGGHKFEAGPIAFVRFYNDGSVDSEVTLTLRLDEPTNALKAPLIVSIFREFADEVTNGDYDVSGAGMHMAWLNSPDASYPTNTERDGDTDARYNNFYKSMGLLMPALFFLGTSNEASREMHFRKPGVGDGVTGSSKYYAIRYYGGALEYRVFDTCYDSPQAILDNLQVMAKTLRYWTIEYTRHGLSRITSQVRFGNEHGDGTLKGFYRTNTHLELLNAGLAKLKPSYMTVRELKRQRKFDLTQRSFEAKKAEIAEQAKSQYQEYSERWDWGYQIQRHKMTATVMDGLGVGTPESEMEEHIVRMTNERVQPKQALSDYINQKIRDWQNSSMSGEYMLRA